MISLLTEPLPDSIQADGREHRILTDFRDWIRFLLLVSSDAPDIDKAAMLPLWLAEPVPLTRGIVEGLRGFCLARELSPDAAKKDDDEDEPPPHRPPTWDWTIDGKFVLGDFRRYYGLDLLRVEHLHWWEFRALFEALPGDSCSMQRINIRGKDLSKLRTKSEKQYYAELQRRLALPFEMDEDAIADVFAGMM